MQELYPGDTVYNRNRGGVGVRVGIQRRSYPRAAKHVRTKMGETVLSHAIRNTLQDKKCSLSDWERFEKCHHFETGHSRRETLSVSVLSLSCAAKVSFHMFSNAK